MGTAWAEFAEPRFEHRSVPDCHRSLVPAPVRVVTCPKPCFHRGREEARRGKMTCPRSPQSVSVPLRQPQPARPRWHPPSRAAGAGAL